MEELQIIEYEGELWNNVKDDLNIIDRRGPETTEAKKMPKIISKK